LKSTEGAILFKFLKSSITNELINMKTDQQLFHIFNLKTQTVC